MRLACDSRNSQARHGTSPSNWRTKGSRHLKAQLHTTVRGAAERGKTEDFRVMLVGQVVDSPKDRKVWRNVILRSDVYEGIILDIEIRKAKVQFFSRVYELCLDHGAEFFPP